MGMNVGHDWEVVATRHGGGVGGPPIHLPTTELCPSVCPIVVAPRLRTPPPPSCVSMCHDMIVQNGMGEGCDVPRD
jgi:hypothetical protein